MGTINGAELAIQMYQHTQELNVEFDYRTVEEVKEENGLKLVCCKEDGAVYAARTVILATGTRPRTLGVENEKNMQAMESAGVPFATELPAGDRM